MHACVRDCHDCTTTLLTAKTNNALTEVLASAAQSVANLNDTPRQRADVRPAVATDLSFVTHAAERDALEGPLQHLEDKREHKDSSPSTRPTSCKSLPPSRALYKPSGKRGLHFWPKPIKIRTRQR